MQALWIILTLLAAGGLGWPVTVGVLRLAKTVDAADARAGLDPAEDPAADTTTGMVAETAEAPSIEGRDGPDAAANVNRDDSGLASPNAKVLRGGLVIGILERLAVVVTILANEPIAIAYIVAIKGLGRYPELKETPAAAERFIIGTLSSMLWAAGLATVAKMLLLH